MIVIKNKIIPPPGFKALTIWPCLFVRAKYMTEKDMRHEEIHGCQQKELLVCGVVLAILLALAGCGWWSLMALPLWLWVYVGLWVYAAIKCLTGGEALGTAYRKNPLEREAYFFEGDEGYIERRKAFAWTNFM